jgi:hypothetical protein
MAWQRLRRFTGLLGLLGLVGLLGLSPNEARAADPATTPIEIAPELGAMLDRGQLARALRIELGNETDLVLVRVTPDGDTGVAVTIRGSRGAPLTEKVSLNDVPANARVRVLALAIAEMARRQPPHDAPKEPTPPPKTTLPPETKAPASAHDSALGIEGGTTLLVTTGRWLPLVRGYGRIAIGSWLGVRISAEGTGDRSDDTLGRLQFVALLGALSLDARVQSGFVQFEGGPQLRVGALFGSSDPHSSYPREGAPAIGASATDVIVLAGLAVRAIAPARGLFFGTLGAGGAAAVQGVTLRADDRRRVGLTGSMLEGMIGFGLRL